MRLRRPGIEHYLGTLAFLVAVAFWNLAPEGALVLRWCIPAVALPGILILSGIDIEWTPAHIAGALFLLWAFISFLWAFERLDAAQALLQLELVAAPAFLIGAKLRDFRPVYLGMGLGLAVSAVVAVLQLMDINIVQQVENPSGLWVNRDTMGLIAALVLIGAISTMAWAAIPGSLVCLVLSGCRGAYLAVAVAAMVALWRHSRAFAIAAFAFLSLMLLAISRSAAPGSSVGQRLASWQDMWDGMTWLGRGIGSFYTAWPEHAGHYLALMNPARPEYAHNDFLQAAFELGPIGAILMAMVFAFCLFGRGTERLVVIALGTEALTQMPLQLPATLFLGALAAGACAARSSGPVLDLLHRVRVAFPLRHRGLSAKAGAPS